jgi:glucose/arabinose dehydrogenase
VRAAQRPGICLLAALCLLVLAGAAAAAPQPPANFIKTAVASGLSAPTAMVWDANGRLFVTEQSGNLRVIEDGALLATPFVHLTVDWTGERGLLGVTLDPDFDNNHYLYLYYTVPGSPPHNRVSRFTAQGNVAAPGSEQVLLDLNSLSSATNHNGGAIHFGPDGTLYVAAGDNASGSNSQTLSGGNLLGKILRMNSDGTIPTDNPFYLTQSGNSRLIWAYGLRNPYTFTLQPGTTRMFINDVGQGTWEEIDDGIAGSNYGWPDEEGPAVPPNPAYTDPLFSYGHGNSDTLGCAITGGAFYNPPVAYFPAEYVGRYFFSDFCSGWIRQLDPANGNAVTGFTTGVGSPVDLNVAPDASLYYLSHGGNVGRISYQSTPTLTSFAPGAGGAGAQVAIRGTYLAGATAVTFNGTPATFSVVWDTWLVIMVPPGATTGPISVTTAAGTTTSAGDFTVLPTPSISSFSPTSGPAGTTVTISGLNFTGATAVKFNGTNAQSFTVDSDTQITAIVAAGTTSGTISVTGPYATATSAGSFTVPPAPSISSFKPTSARAGKSVTISGLNLKGTKAVKFNGTPAKKFQVKSNSKIVAVVASGSTSGPISVTGPNGQGTSAGSFTVVP